MLKDTVKWFHIAMGHHGEKRLRESLQQRYHHNKLRHTIDKYKCEHCQKQKNYQAKVMDSYLRVK